MKKPRYKRNSIIFFFVATLIIALIYFAPIFIMIVSAFKDTKVFFDPSAGLFPKKICWENFKYSVTMIPFFTYLKNTTIITIGCVTGIMISVSLVGYGFSRIQWKGRDQVFVFVLSTMMVPFFITVIPLFSMYTKIGWTNTLLPLIVPAFFGNPLYIFIMKEFFKTIPMSLSEAAKIDGCNEIQIFGRVCLPLVKTPIVVCIILEIMFCWSDFMRPIIFLNDMSLYTLAIGLQKFVALHCVDWGPMMACALLTALPLIILYFLFQKYFIAGITMTGLKD